MDRLREIVEMRTGEKAPHWYHPDVGVQELARRVLALEEERSEMAKRSRSQSDERLMRTSNTRECFSCCVGRRVVGVLFDALPVGDAGLASGNKTLVFEDGYGLTISSNGSYWTESREDVKRAVQRKRDELERTAHEIEEALELAGAEAFR